MNTGLYTITAKRQCPINKQQKYPITAKTQEIHICFCINVLYEDNKLYLIRVNTSPSNTCCMHIKTVIHVNAV